MKKRVQKILWGVVFLALGLLIGLERLGVLPVDLFFNGWWTLIIIIPSLISLATEREKLGPAIGLLIGVSLFLSINGLMDFGIISSLIFPTILLLIGLKLITDEVVKKKDLPQDVTASDDHRYCVTFGEKKLDYNGKKVENLELDVAFGAITLDLKGAKLEKDIVIKVSCVFGGVKMTLPADVDLVDKTTNVFGGVGVERDTKVEREGKAKATVFLTGSCTFGGVEVK